MNIMWGLAISPASSRAKNKINNNILEGIISKFIHAKKIKFNLSNSK